MKDESKKVSIFFLVWSDNIFFHAISCFLWRICFSEWIADRVLGSLIVREGHFNWAVNRRATAGAVAD